MDSVKKWMAIGSRYTHSGSGQWKPFPARFFHHASGYPDHHERATVDLLFDPWPTAALLFMCSMAKKRRASAPDSRSEWKMHPRWTARGNRSEVLMNSQCPSRTSTWKNGAVHHSARCPTSWIILPARYLYLKHASSILKTLLLRTCTLNIRPCRQRPTSLLEQASYKTPQFICVPLRSYLYKDIQANKQDVFLLSPQCNDFPCIHLKVYWNE